MEMTDYDVQHKELGFSDDEAIQMSDGLSFDKYQSDESINSDGSSGKHKNYDDLLFRNYSKKVFVGGLPFDVTEDDIITAFSEYGRLTLDWPRKNECDKPIGPKQSHGYVFLIFNENESVTNLLSACFRDRDRFFLEFKTKSGSKSVQIRPWSEKDSYYKVKYINGELIKTLKPRNTIFIGGVPRPTRAADLAKIVEDVFGKVVYASIDTDPELCYPKGAARLVFHRREDYIKAMTEKYVDLNHCGTRKRLEVKPYIVEEQKCDLCGGLYSSDRPASYFCVDPLCLRYYCDVCWDYIHYGRGTSHLCNHLPYVRSGESTRQLTSIPHHRGFRKAARVCSNEFFETFCKDYNDGLSDDPNMIYL